VLSFAVAMMVFSLNNPKIPSRFFFLMAYMNLTFLVIESRRYNLFALSRNRVLMLERGFYGRSLLSDVHHDFMATPRRDLWPPSSNWKICLKTLLLAPLQHSEQLTWGAVYIRLTRNYGYLFLACYIGWCFKLSLLDSAQGFPWTTFAVVSGACVAIVTLIYIVRPADGGLGLPYPPPPEVPEIMHRPGFQPQVPPASTPEVRPDDDAKLDDVTLHVARHGSTLVEPGCVPMAAGSSKPVL
jgi:hypothetical protein